MGQRTRRELSIGTQLSGVCRRHLETSHVFDHRSHEVLEKVQGAERKVGGGVAAERRGDELRGGAVENEKGKTNFD